MILKLALCVVVVVLVVPPAEVVAKTKFDMFLELMNSQNKFLQQRGINLGIAKVKNYLKDNFDSFKKLSVPLINASLPLLNYERTEEVLTNLIPLISKYSRPKLLRLLRSKDFRTLAFTLIDDFYEALQNKTGIDEKFPAKSISTVFERIDWKKIARLAYPLTNHSSLLYNPMFVPIISDFIPKRIVVKFIPVIDKFLWRLKNAKPDLDMQRALSLIKKDLYNANLTGLSDDFFGNAKMILGQVQWLPVLKALQPKISGVLERVFISNSTSVKTAFRKLTSGLLDANYSGLIGDPVEDFFTIASQIHWPSIIRGIKPLFKSNPKTVFMKVFKIALRTYKLLKKQMGDDGDGSFSILSLISTAFQTFNASSLFGIPEDVSHSCHRDIMHTIEGTFTFKKWALTMLDAHGKIGPGLQRGRLHAMGSYEQCKDVKVYYKSGAQRFHGRYCRIMFDLNETSIAKMTGKEIPMNLSLAWGLCVPDSCSSNDVKNYLPTDFLKSYQLPLMDIYCGEKPHLASDTGAIVAICIIILIVTILIIGTAFDLVMKCKDDFFASKKDNKLQKGVEEHELRGLQYGDDEIKIPFGDKRKEKSLPLEEYVVLRDGNIGYVKENVCFEILRSTSLVSNLQSLSSRHVSSGTIRCIHGIRVFSMSWIILISTYYFAVFSEIGIPLTENLLDAKRLMQRFIVQLVTSGPLAIDTFLVLGGTLTMFWMLKRLEHDQTIKLTRVVQYITHRLIRILPPYMIVLMAFSNLYQYNGHGPLWFRTQPAAEHCHQYWWTNLLFINNIVHNKEPCMPWTWYLANDMQYYLISLGLIILIYKWSKIGLVVVACLGSVGIISTAVLEHQGAGSLLVKPTSSKYVYKYDIWMAPWCRITPYMIGLVVGYVLHKVTQIDKQKFQLHFFLGWLLCLTVGFTIVLIPYTEMGRGREPWTQSGRTAFEALSHPVFALCVSYVIFSCHYGYGGYINRFLSWTIFVPLSRVTFVAYLVHPIMMVLYVYTRMQLIYLADFALLYMFIGHWIITYILAFLLTACLEMPFRKLEKLTIYSKARCCCK